jgi:hypothetical protein
MPLHNNCHPERSRLSGVAKDLSLNRPSAYAKLPDAPSFAYFAKGGIPLLP